MEQLSKFFTEVVSTLKSLSGYLQNVERHPWVLIKKDKAVFSIDDKTIELTEHSTKEEALSHFGLEEQVAEGFITFVINFLCHYGLVFCNRIEVMFDQGSPRIDFTVNRRGALAHLTVHQEGDKVKVTYDNLTLSEASDWDFNTLVYVAEFLKQLYTPVPLTGCSSSWSIIQCFAVMTFISNDCPFKDFTYNILVSGEGAKLHIKYKGDPLLEVSASYNGRVFVGTNPFNKTEMTVRQLIAVMIDFGPMIEMIKGMKVIGEFNRAAVFSHFYMLQDLFKILLPFKGEKAVCLGDRERTPFVIINNHVITIDLYTETVSWYLTTSTGPAEWNIVPINDAYVALKGTLEPKEDNNEAEQDEQPPVITKEDIEKCEVKAEPEPEEEPEDAQEEEEDTEEDSSSEDESDQGEEDSSEDDDEWDSDDSEEDDDDLFDEDDEEEEEDDEDSEDDSDEEDEDSDSDDGDGESESDDDDGSEESVEQSLVTRPLSSICSFMFARVFPMFTGQPGSKLEIKDKGDTVIVSWPGSPCPVQLTLTGYPKDSKDPEGSWLFEATASFKDRTFSTDPQSLIECVNDYKETLEALTSAPSK